MINSSKNEVQLTSRLPFPLRAREALKAPTETLATLAPKRYTVATEKAGRLQADLDCKSSRVSWS